VSPLPECGKTTMLKMLERLCVRAQRRGSITLAVLVRKLHNEQCTMLIDEGDGYDLTENVEFRKVFNDSFEKGGIREIMEKGEPKRFNVFGPLAFATIGDNNLPPACLSRAIIVPMHRSTREGLRRIDDPTAEADLLQAFRCAYAWVRTADLNPEPDMLPQFRGRVADRWRALFAVADSFSEEWGEWPGLPPSSSPGDMSLRTSLRRCLWTPTPSSTSTEIAFGVSSWQRTSFRFRTAPGLKCLALSAALAAINEHRTNWGSSWASRFRFTRNPSGVVV
jgi:hypothetical protein